MYGTSCTEIAAKCTNMTRIWNVLKIKIFGPIACSTLIMLCTTYWPNNLRKRLRIFVLFLTFRVNKFLLHSFHWKLFPNKRAPQIILEKFLKKFGNYYWSVNQNAFILTVLDSQERSKYLKLMLNMFFLCLFINES